MSSVKPKGGADEALCALCPKLCRFACPVTNATADEGATPTVMMESLLAARAGAMDWSAAAEVLQRCCGCEACRVPCEYDQDVPSMLYQARAEAWEQAGPPESLSDLHATHLRTGNPFGVDIRSVLDEHANKSDFQRKGRVLYWPGCRSLSRFPERIGAEMQLLRTLGAEHISLPGREDVPTCCGGVLRTMGDKGGLQASAAGLQQYFNRQRTWVTPCSSCLQTVRQGYPSVGIEINAEVLHLGQYLLFFLDRLAELGREAMEAREAADSPTPTILVHSSCGLHRRLGREEPIARIIAAVTGQVPDALPPGPDKSPCCGAGDFHDLRRPAAAAEVAEWSFRTARPARGTWVVTTDITCVGALQLGLPDEVRTFDLVGFLLEWLGPVL